MCVSMLFFFFFQNFARMLQIVWPCYTGSPYRPTLVVLQALLSKLKPNNDYGHLHRLHLFRWPCTFISIVFLLMTMYIYLDCISFDDPVHIHRRYFFWWPCTFISIVFLLMTMYIYIDCISFDDLVHIHRRYFFWWPCTFRSIVIFYDTVHLHQLYFFGWPCTFTSNVFLLMTLYI